MDHYSPKQVARRLGVSESSVKRWLDQGVVPVLRTAGGHRRVSAESLEELLNQLKATSGFPRLSSLGDDAKEIDGTRTEDAGAVPSGRLAGGDTGSRLKDPLVPGGGGLPGDGSDWNLSATAAGPPDLKELSDTFTEALAKGDFVECERLTDRLIQLGYPVSTAADLLLTPAMHRLGARWECGEAAVFQERRACGIGAELIRRLKQRLPTHPTGPIAIGGTPAGDLYELPTAMVELALRERGWNATSLGCNLPVGEFLAAVEEYRPRLVWLSLSHVTDEDALVEQFNRLVASLPRHVAVLIGGRAATDSLRPRLRYTGHCDSLRNLTDFADTLVPNR